MDIRLVKHSDGLHRCSWCGEGEKFDDYIHYHDNEWGRPLKSDRAVFEKVVLEGFQSGLSWITILRKREHFRKVFEQFDFEKVAQFTDKKVEALVLDAGIIRHRGKIKSAINNAQKVCDLIDQKGPGAFADLIWSFRPKGKIRAKAITPEIAKTLTHTEQSTALSKQLRRLGFNFVGPTTMYAMMQSIGMVNDHLEGCSHWQECQDLQAQI